jgi:4-amino-4-deoxy-L-arabinose transferase-like glycosyltransferase
VRLVPHGYASTDEGRYIDAGHQLIYEFWHGGGSPYFETYFSGAPVFYSPLAAMADCVGGLAAVRLLSTVFSLTTSCLLFGTGKRLFGYWSGVASAALFAGLSLTQVVGRNAIYDAMALMLMAAAAYCAARTGRGASATWLLLVPVVLLAADFAKYITLLFNGTVILIAAYQARDGGFRAIIRRMLVVGFTTVCLLVLGLFLAGTAYLQGIMFTTLARKSGANIILGASPAPARVIALEAWRWFGLVVVVAFAAAAFALLFPRERKHSWFLLACAITSLLVTVEALHLHSDESSGRHDDFAAWFACLAVGYLFTTASRLIKWTVLSRCVAALAVAFILVTGFLYSFGPNAFQNHGFQGNTEILLSVPAKYGILKPYLSTGQRYLLTGADSYAILYNDHVHVHWWNLADDSYIKYPVPGRGGNWHGTARGPVCLKLNPHCVYLEGIKAYQAAIAAHAFAVISVTRLQLYADRVIIKAVEHTRGYLLLTTSGGGPTWIYARDYRS